MTRTIYLLLFFLIFTASSYAGFDASNKKVFETIGLQKVNATGIFLTAIDASITLIVQEKSPFKFTGFVLEYGDESGCSQPNFNCENNGKTKISFEVKKVLQDGCGSFEYTGKTKEKAINTDTIAEPIVHTGDFFQEMEISVTDHSERKCMDKMAGLIEVSVKETAVYPHSLYSSAEFIGFYDSVWM